MIPEGRSLFQSTSQVPVRLATGPTVLTNPIPSADGKKLFVDAGQVHSQLIRYDSKAKRFVPFLGGISARQVDFSRDGQWVTYVTVTYVTGQAADLWRSKVDGSERLQLTFPPIRAREPRWSPNGKEIIFTAEPSKIFVVSPDGGAPQQLVAEDKNEVVGAATWSPDSNSIVFVRGSWPQTAIYRMDLKTRDVTELPNSNRMYSARLSPDGRYISAFRTDGEVLMLYDFKTGTWSELARGGRFDMNNWSRDSKFVYVTQIANPPVELDRVSIADRKLEHFLSLKDISPNLVGWISLDPNNSPVLTSDSIIDEIYSLNLQVPRF